MKNIVLTVAVFLCTFSFSATAQDDAFDPVIKAFSESDARSLSSFFNLSVELCLPGNESTYSTSQAEMIMKEFFKKNPSDSLTVLEKGTTDAKSRFVIGEYTSGTSQFKVFIYLKEEKDRLLIQKIRVDEKK
jgi:hypothetical protein